MENNRGKISPTEEKIYNMKELLGFLFYKSSFFRKILVFLFIFILFESFFSNRILSQGKMGGVDSTGGLIIIYIAVFMVITNSFILLMGAIISTREVKKTFLAKMSLPFIAIILAFIVTFIIDTIMPSKIFYTLAKALYII